MTNPTGGYPPREFCFKTAPRSGSYSVHIPGVYRMPCCCCCSTSNFNSQNQVRPWSQDRLQSFWSGGIPQHPREKTQTKNVHARIIYLTQCMPPPEKYKKVKSGGQPCTLPGRYRCMSDRTYYIIQLLYFKRPS